MGTCKLSLKDFGIDIDAMDDAQKQEFSVRITNLLIDKFFEGDFSPELRKKFLCWLADERNADIKEAALKRRFDTILNECTAPDDYREVPIDDCCEATVQPAKSSVAMRKICRG